MAVSKKDWEQPNSRMWLTKIDIDRGLGVSEKRIYCWLDYWKILLVFLVQSSVFHNPTIGEASMRRRTAHVS